MKYVFSQGKKERWKAEKSDTKLFNVLLGNTIITLGLSFLLERIHLHLY